MLQTKSEKQSGKAPGSISRIDAYHSYRRLQDPSLINPVSVTSFRTRSWMRLHDAAVRQCLEMRKQLDAESDSARALMAAAASISNSREADAQSAFNTLAAVASFGLGIPATAEELPDAVAVMDPFHVVRLAGDAMDGCRRRVQQELHGHRRRTGDPLYAARRRLHTGVDLLTEKQQDRLAGQFAADEDVEVEATWGIYQRMIAAYPTSRRAAS